MQILGTLDKPSNKDCNLIIDNIDILNLGQEELCKFRNSKIGFIFQFHQLLPEFTAIENVCIPGYIKKTNQVDLLKRANELLSYLNLEEKINKLSNKLQNKAYLKNAPREIVQNDKVLLRDLSIEENKLRSIVSSINNVKI